MCIYIFVYPHIYVCVFTYARDALAQLKESYQTHERVGVSHPPSMAGESLHAHTHTLTLDGGGVLAVGEGKRGIHKLLDTRDACGEKEFFKSLDHGVREN